MTVRRLKFQRQQTPPQLGDYETSTALLILYIFYQSAYDLLYFNVQYCEM